MIVSGTSATMARPNNPSRQPPVKRRTFASGGFARIRTTASATAAAAHTSMADLFGALRGFAGDWLAASFIVQRPDRLNERTSFFPRHALQHRSVRSLEIV